MALKLAHSGKSRQHAIPPHGGVGLKAQHYRHIIEHSPDIGFFEVHAENYMGAGGPPHRYLNAIRDRYPLSLHGVGLSIGADTPLDRAHLARLKELIARYEPGLFSEHLAWSTHRTHFYNDLLPLPYTPETLERVCDHVDEVQNALGRQILLENPSTYVVFTESSYSEPAFISEIARRTGCGLLFDVNNLQVSCTNHEWNPFRYIAEYPLDRVQEIHLAGHKADRDETGRPLLIDTHDRLVSVAVWQLYKHVIGLVGAVPTLIEWDVDIPAWPELQAEAHRADVILTASAGGMRHAAAG
ncbi:MAG: DUF692 domain-containing protein [Alphaproteobacteria bacterium]|nr:DUF692 domain-containing protein [Alphaproteobacteria bacterium]